MDNSSAKPAALDQVALLLSGLCLLHCLLLPLLVVIVPFLGQLGDDHLHAELLLIVVPVSLVALLLGYRRHARRDVIAWGVAGLLTLIVGGTIAHSTYGLLADRSLTVAGSIMLAVTHLRNFRLSRAALASAAQ